MSEEIVVKSQISLEQEVKDDLIQSGFSVTNWSLGSRMRRFVAAVTRPISELYLLVAEIKKQMYLKTATGTWLILKGADEGVPIKEPTKTLGSVIIGRTQIVATPVSIPSGSLLKTEIDLKGNELRYITTTTIILPSSQKEILVPVIAEFEGSEYNIGTGLISSFLTHIDGVDYVKNEVDWISTLGTDLEDQELYRQRVMNEKKLRRGDWNALYKSLATSVTGVKDAEVISNHPRGQGTINVVIVTENGIVPPILLQEVQTKIDIGKELCADVLAVAAQTQAVDITLALTVTKDVIDLEPYRLKALAIIDDVFSKKKIGQSYIKADSISKTMSIDNARNSVISLPLTDVKPSSSVLLIKGTITVAVAREV
jgi:hypothetical protein